MPSDKALTLGGNQSHLHSGLISPDERMDLRPEYPEIPPHTDSSEEPIDHQS